MNLAAVKSFKSIDLEETSRVQLMKRTDKKFLIPAKILNEVFQAISDKYYILEINNEKLLGYKTVYFDTEDRQLYKCHHNGKLNRYKIRKRVYLETNVCYLEIKFKTNKGKTIKERIKSSSDLYELSKEELDYLHANLPFKPSCLIPRISNRFIRMTLVNKNFNERCTVDCNIDFTHKNNTGSFENLVIIEVKQDGQSNNSPITNKLNELRIKSTGFSKYCMGSALLNPDIKQNAFKAKLRTINKLTS